MRRWITILTCLATAAFLNACGDDGHADGHTDHGDAGHNMDAMTDTEVMDMGVMDMGMKDMGAMDGAMDMGAMDGAMDMGADTKMH